MQIDENVIVKYKDELCTLEKAMKNIQPGEIIENIPIEWFTSVLEIIEKEKNKNRNEYSVDRRYGKWRFALFGKRD